MAVQEGETFARILDDAKAGEADAFEWLFRRLNRQVYAFAAARRSQDADGLVNEVFLRVFRGLAAFDGNETQFTAWVFRITRNLLIDDARKRTRRHEEIPTEELTSPDAGERIDAASAADAETVALEQMSGEALLGYLEPLTPDQRDVILLRVVADQSIEVVAEMLDKRISSVKSTQYRAMRVLHASLQGSSEKVQEPRDLSATSHVRT